MKNYFTQTHTISTWILQFKSICMRFFYTDPDARYQMWKIYSKCKIYAAQKSRRRKYINEELLFGKTKFMLNSMQRFIINMWHVRVRMCKMTIMCCCGRGFMRKDAAYARLRKTLTSIGLQQKVFFCSAAALSFII